MQKIIKKLKALSILIIFTYQGKLVMSIVFVSLITFFLLTSNRMMLMKEFIYERAMKRIESMSAVLINEVQENLLEKDTADLRTIITLAAKQADIQFISILNQGRGVQYSTDSGIEINKITYEDSRSISSEKRDAFVKTYPLIGANGTVGYMQIGFSLKEIRADLKESLHWALWLDGIMLIFMVMISWLVSGFLLRPLSEMKNVSMEIAGGNFAARAHVRSPDIIGALAGALNEMAAQLGDLTGNMNERIKKATCELEAKNKELHEKTCQLEAFNKQLMELDTLKSEFVSMASHELRTPLTSIIGFSKTLSTLNLTDEQRKRYLSIIEAEGKRLSNLIEAFLDISKIESGNFVLNIAPVNFETIIKELWETFEAQSRNRIEIKNIRQLPDVSGDKDKLKSVLLNLLENALRYNPPGEKIIVSGRMDNGQVIITVQDHGPGIEQAESEKIFERFYRGKDSIARKERGSGLGLAIVRGIVEAHSGKIWVESEAGKGAAFSFMIPVPG